MNNAAATLAALTFAWAGGLAPSAWAADLDASVAAPPRSAVYAAKISHRGVPSGGPNCGVVAYQSPIGSLWLGHFTGGSVGPAGPVPGGVDWRDIYACFASRADCHAWQRDLRRRFHRLEGYRTCLVIR